MLKAATLWHNAGWGVLSSLLYGGGRLVLFMLISRFWAASTFGMMMLAWAVVTPLSYLLNLELRLVLVTDASGALRAGDCFRLRLVSNFLLLLALALLCFWRFDHWGWDKVVVMMLVGMVRVVESWAELFLAIVQRHEKMKLVAGSHGLKIAFLVAWLLAGAAMEFSISVLLFGWMLTVAGVVWFYDRWWASRFEPIDTEQVTVSWKTLLQAGVPLGIFMTLVHLNDGVGKYYLEAREMGDTLVGYLGAIGVLITGVIMVQSGVNQALLPRLAAYKQVSIAKFFKLLGGQLVGGAVLGGALVAVAAAAGGDVLTAVFGKGYGEYEAAFLWMAGGGAVMVLAMIVGDAVVACHHFTGRMVSVGAALVVHLITGWWWIRGDEPLVGAGRAFGAGSVVMLVVAAAVLGLSVRKSTKNR